MYCLKCGTKVTGGDKFCPTCGARLDSGAPQQTSGGNKSGFEDSVYDDLAAQIICQRQQGAPESQSTPPRPRHTPEDIQRYTDGYTEDSGKKKQHTTIIVLLVIAILLAVLALVVFTKGFGKDESPRPAEPASSQSVEISTEEPEPEPEQEQPQEPEPDASAGAPADTSIPADVEIAGHQATGSPAQPAAPEEEPQIEETDYILPGVDTGYIDRAVLEAMTDEELRLARNEIYARHGRMFDSADLDQYFRSTSWYIPAYSPEEFDALGDSVLNQYEIANRDLIVEIEAARKG